MQYSALGVSASGVLVLSAILTEPHRDDSGKANVGEYLVASGLPHTRIVNSFYFENLANPAYGIVTKNEAGTSGVRAVRAGTKRIFTGEVIVNCMTLPDTYIPGYSANQSGGWVLAALKNREQYLGARAWSFLANNSLTYTSRQADNRRWRAYYPTQVRRDPRQGIARCDSQGQRDEQGNLRCSRNEPEPL